MRKAMLSIGAACLAMGVVNLACSDALGSGCEVVTAGNTRIQITNATGSGLTVSFSDFAFEALMRPGACEIFGIPSRTANLDLTRCTFAADDDCRPMGQTVSRSFALTSGETLAVTIDQSFF